VSPKAKVKEEVTVPTTPETAIKQEAESMDVHLTTTDSDEYPKGVTFLEVVELSPIVIKSLVSDHITSAVNNCVIKGIKIEGGKRKRHRAVYLNLTNSSSESEIESSNVSIILDTPFFNAKVEKKPKLSPIPSSSFDTLSPISFSSGHDTDVLIPFQ